MEIFEIYGEQKTLTQWDLGRKMQVHVPCQQLHFANEGAKEALVSPVEETGGVLTARIPDEVLQQSGPLWVYAFVEAEEGYTKRIRSFFVKERPQPAGYVYTPTQWVKLEDVMARMDALEGRPETDPTVPAWAKQPQKPAYTAVEVGARPDHWIPTPGEIGAAPAGYGLGGFAVPVPGNNLDTLKANGWYYCADSTAGGPSGYALGNAVVEVSAGWAYSPVHQTLHFGTAGRQPFTIKRYWNNATNSWVDWEWINPPMLTGVEYRTTERYKGKAVYTKLINFGYLPNATKGGIAIDVDATLVIRCKGVTSNGYTLPYNYNGSVIELCAEKGWILITTNKDYSTAMADIQIWYTKD